MIVLFGHDCYTIEEVREKLNVKTTKSVYWWIKTNKIRTIPYQKTNVIPKVEIDALFGEAVNK